MHNTWANDSDTDDVGIPDGWELENDLNVTDGTDRGHDLDGDGISNIDEYKAKTGSHNFWSFPPLSFNTFYRTIVFLIIFISVTPFIFVRGYFFFQEKR